MELQLTPDFNTGRGLYQRYTKQLKGELEPET